MKRDIVYSSKHNAELVDYPIEDIDRDDDFIELFLAARNHTMTSKDTMYSLYQAVKYVSLNKIPGDFVECGVWRGGSSILAGLTFNKFEGRSKSTLRGKLRSGTLRNDYKRKLWLYDTFEGMSVPTDVDIDNTGNSAKQYIDQFADDGQWCYASMEDVSVSLEKSGIRQRDVKLVKGDVLKTLQKHVPRTISVLRLDTDWYESTKYELEVLYPRLAKGGVLIIDDYGHWEGSRKAVDEYFANRKKPLLNRINYAVRVAVKI